MDERGTFREDNFQKAVAQITDAAVDAGKAKKKGGSKKGEQQGENSDIFKLVKMIIERNFDPVCLLEGRKSMHTVNCILFCLCAADLLSRVSARKWYKEKQFLTTCLKQAPLTGGVRFSPCLCLLAFSLEEA